MGGREWRGEDQRRKCFNLEMDRLRELVGEEEGKVGGIGGGRE